MYRDAQSSSQRRSFSKGRKVRFRAPRRSFTLDRRFRFRFRFRFSLFAFPHPQTEPSSVKSTRGSNQRKYLGR